MSPSLITGFKTVGNKYLTFNNYIMNKIFILNIIILDFTEQTYEHLYESQYIYMTRNDFSKLTVFISPWATYETHIVGKCGLRFMCWS